MNGEIKSNKCIGCVFWDMWENICMFPDRLGQYKNPDASACKDYEEEATNDKDTARSDD